MISILAKMQLYSLITSADLSFIPSIVEELRQVPCPTLSLSMARYLRENYTTRHWARPSNLQYKPILIRQ
jgi:hypothetical protein